jgi:hypothetical protein
MLQEADVAAVSRQFRLAVLKDAKVDVTALSEPIERWMDEPSPSLLSNGKLNVVEVDEPPTEPAESNERSDSDSKEELRRQEAENKPFWNRFGRNTCWPVDRDGGATTVGSDDVVCSPGAGSEDGTHPPTAK